MNKCLLLLIVAFIFGNTSFSQVFSDKVVGKKNTSLADSLKVEKYPYSLPIWGAKVTAKGYDLPYSAGVSVNYFQQESALLLSNLYVGFNNGPMYNLDEIVRFNDATATAAALTIRPDIWLFPFLDIYAIIGKARTSTEISAGVYLPDTANVWNEIASFSSIANFDATSFGLGITPTIGIGGGWLAMDMNVAWTDVDALDKPVFTFVFDPRAGKTFRFKKPEQNLNVWIGAMRVQFSSETAGSLPLSEVIPTDDIQGKVDQGLEKVEETSAQLESWWGGLTPIEQKNPVNIAKYSTANRALTTASNVLTSIDGALNDDQTATVQYSLDKTLKNKWNFLVGSQYQLNKHFMVRAEVGFLGTRNQVMGSVQYRFGL
jgi:hypothetical protein